MSFFPMAGTALKNLFSRPATRLYPAVKRVPFEGTRGKIAIDFPSCILCGICSKRCPTQAITVSKADRQWKMDHLACVICTNCVIVCPKKCLSLQGDASASVPYRVKENGTETHTNA